MELPRIAGRIDRRLLVNFRVDAVVASGLVPTPFRPKLVQGHAVAGICLIRLSHLRPSVLSAGFGLGSENAAHRIAVTWDENRCEREGVFVPRRDTSSRINTLLGGRVFPGVQHHASFEVRESPPHYEVAFRSDDGELEVALSGRVALSLPGTSIFSSIQEASTFFQRGAVGYSAGRGKGRFDGLELDTQSWHVEPFEVEDVRSSFIDGLPRGSAVFDSALIMSGLEHEWRPLNQICAA
jgi:hypothetical protein